MSDFLLELRSEEIPARMQKGARAELEKLFRREMQAAGVAVGELTVWSTPRRLALIARGLPTETEAVREEAKGPPEGAPDQAVDGFCRKNGVSRDQLEVREVKGRNTFFAVIEKPGQAVADLLAAAIPAIIRDFSWPKSMRWGAASMSTESLKWVRPLSGIVALLDGEVVPCITDGLASGRETKGHRFHFAGPITIDGADAYADALRAASVIVDHEERQDIIREGAKAAAEAAGLKLVEDEGLVVENAGLTEWPVPLLGRFEDDFLDVPPETIQLTARVNQKYFVCEDASGELANAFICTANIEAVDPAVVVDGNRKVLAARLSDAKHFWFEDQYERDEHGVVDTDRRKTLAEHAKGLERITFHEKLGTVADKVERVAKLARWLCEEGIVKDTPVTSASTVTPAQAGVSSGGAQTPEMPASAGTTKERLAELAEQAARLCKADLVTEMVGEFPELQGLMGGYYAAKEGLPVEVSDAIRDHRKPDGQGDEVPTALVTAAVSLADKWDTLVAFFEISERPTGSKDPFALRRATIGAISTALAIPVRCNLLDIFDQVVEIVNAQRRSKATEVVAKQDGNGENELVPAKFAYVPGVIDAKSTRGGVERYRTSWDLLDFFADRLKVQQKEAGVRHDLIDAVFALGGEDDLVRLLARVKALQSFIETDEGTNLLAGYKRAANILKKEKWEAPEHLDVKSVSYSPETAEKALIDALDGAAPKAAAAIESEDFEAAMAALASLRAPIDAFFEEVTVNDNDPAKREARLTLLARFRDAVHRVADFSRIEG